MAGGSQIIIDDQGITVKTNGQAVFKAAQHCFQDGEAVLMPHTALAMHATDYSNQFHYALNMHSAVEACQQQAWSSYVLDRQSGQLMASGHTQTAQGISTHRVYSESSQAIMGVLCFSDRLNVQQQSPQQEQQPENQPEQQPKTQQAPHQDQQSEHQSEQQKTFMHEDPLLFEALYPDLDLSSDG